ncbi:MAG TPA: hypothetical protein PLX35_03620 [Cyclobacteriaceae bacterium]|nr:hypothetical protein [Cyclobacteriaceae bacterium]
MTLKLRFERSGYYFIGLLALALWGFWPTYFSKFFDGTADFRFYFHFHAGMVSLWVACLIVQPILIRQKKLKIHRAIGKLSYGLMPLVFISVILLTHFRMQDHVLIEGNQKLYGPHLIVPFKDLLVVGTFFSIAIAYRKNIHVHARAMVATGIAFIEPALVRVVGNTFHMEGGYLVTIGLIYSLLIGLIILERKEPQGRWVFPMLLGMDIIVHSFLIFDIRIGVWEAFASWFASLPLTTA